MNSSNWFRNSILVMILTVVGATLLVAGISLHKSSNQGTQLARQEQALKMQEQALKANVSAQVSNRAKNVETWCGAIDVERGILVTYIATVNNGTHRVPVLHLPQLNCQAIIDQTLQSAEHK